MRLIPWEKEKKLMPNLSLFDDFVDRFFHEDILDNSRIMAVDVIENERDFMIKANLPGINKEEIKVSLKENQLSIEVQQKLEKEEKQGTTLRSERYIGNYHRYVLLPENCDAEAIKAKLADGVLTLNIPKIEPKPKKEITVD